MGIYSMAAVRVCDRYDPCIYMYTCMLMRDAEGRKKEASKVIQTIYSKAAQHTQGSHFSKEK